MSKCHYCTWNDMLYISVYSVLLLLLMWPASSMPVTFCQNIERQIEGIQQIIRKAVNGAPLNLTKQTDSNPVVNTDQCGVIQRLTSYQACEFNLPSEIIDMTYIISETKGLVENLQGFKTANCVLSPALCPYSHLSVWSKIDVLHLWFQDVAACNDVIQSMCSSLNYISV